MLTNEQRAHDLTIAMVGYIYQSNAIPTGTVPNANGEIEKDAFKLYTSIYATSLEAMNREFSK